MFSINRYKELYVNGGTPFEKGIEVDPSVARRGETTPKLFCKVICGAPIIYHARFCHFVIWSFVKIHDISLIHAEPNSSLRSMMSRNRQPMFFVKIAAPSREQKEQLE